MPKWLHHKALATRLRSLASLNQSPASASPDDPCVIQAHFHASFLAFGIPRTGGGGTCGPAFGAPCMCIFLLGVCRSSIGMEKAHPSMSTEQVATEWSHRLPLEASELSHLGGPRIALSVCGWQAAT